MSAGSWAQTHRKIAGAEANTPGCHHGCVIPGFAVSMAILLLLLS